jgi:hypothetical protein
VKHGKAVFGVDCDLEKTADVAHLNVSKAKPKETAGILPAGGDKDLRLDILIRTDATGEQVRIAVVIIAKLTKMSLELLALFVAHYYSQENAERIAQLVKREYDSIVASVKSVGLSSKGLTR